MNPLNVLCPDQASPCTGYGRHARMVLHLPDYDPQDEEGMRGSLGRVDYDDADPLPVPGSADVRKFLAHEGWKLPQGARGIRVTPPEPCRHPWPGGPARQSWIFWY